MAIDCNGKPRCCNSKPAVCPGGTPLVDCPVIATCNNWEQLPTSFSITWKGSAIDNSFPPQVYCPQVVTHLVSNSPYSFAVLGSQCLIGGSIFSGTTDCFLTGRMFYSIQIGGNSTPDRLTISWQWFSDTYTFGGPGTSSVTFFEDFDIGKPKRLRDYIGHPLANQPLTNKFWQTSEQVHTFNSSGLSVEISAAE